jgi:hypothetical protein
LEVPEDNATVAAVFAAVEAAIADDFRHFYPEATVEGLTKAHAVTHWGEAKVTWQTLRGAESCKHTVLPHGGVVFIAVPFAFSRDSRRRPPSPTGSARVEGRNPSALPCGGGVSFGRAFAFSRESRGHPPQKKWVEGHRAVLLLGDTAL